MTDSVALRNVPAGPVRELVAELLGTDMPTSSSVWEKGIGGGREYHGKHGQRVRVLHGPEPHEWHVRWLVHGEEDSTWRAVWYESEVTWRGPFAYERFGNQGIADG